MPDLDNLSVLTAGIPLRTALQVFDEFFGQFFVATGFVIDRKRAQDSLLIHDESDTGLAFVYFFVGLDLGIIAETAAEEILHHLRSTGEFSSLFDFGEDLSCFTQWVGGNIGIRDHLELV